MRELVTSALELIGLVLLVSGGSLWIAGRFGLAAALIFQGAGLIAVSLLLAATAPKPRRA